MYIRVAEVLILLCPEEGILLIFVHNFYLTFYQHQRPQWDGSSSQDSECGRQCDSSSTEVMSFGPISIASLPLHMDPVGIS